MFKVVPLEIPFDYSSEILTAIAELISSSVSLQQNWIVQLAVIDDERMQELNATYRSIDDTTDVLSFHYFEDFSLCAPDEVVGEIVYSFSRLESQAHDFGHSIQEEFYRLTVHGWLHILGFDHETDEEFADMWAVESMILNELKTRFGILEAEEF